MARLLEERAEGCAGLIFIDGAHHFETVMAAFVLADLLCCTEGCIVFEDVWFPAIETVINYAKSNRPGYGIFYRPVSKTSVLRKLHPDRREWYTFTPFGVPARRDWTPC